MLNGHAQSPVLSFVVVVGARICSAELVANLSRCTAAAVLLTVLCSTGLAQTDEALRPAWECLPDETVVAVRIPNGKAIIDDLKASTKLGTILFDEQRIERFKELIKQRNAQEWEEFHENLAEYGLSLDDFLQMLAGESGFALLIDRTEVQEPLLVGLSWVEPGDDLAQRVLDAIGKVVEDHADEEHPVNRVDVEIDGQPVMQLTVPVVSVEIEHGVSEPAEDFENIPENQPGNDVKFSGPEQVEREEVMYARLLLTRLDGRLLLANTFNRTQEVVAEEHVERLSAIFARFLAAHTGLDDGFVARVVSADGVHQALPHGGTTVVESLADLSSFIKLADAETNPTAEKVIKVLGVDKLGVAALRSTLDRSVMHTGMFLAAPAPRHGILALLDQPEIPPAPPAWVPANVVGYHHNSADLGKIYTHLKQMILQEFGPEAEMAFQMAEMQVMAFAQADLATMLSSLGHQHTVLTFEPSTVAQVVPGPVAMQSIRLSVVWQVKDEAIWTRVLQGLSQIAEMSQGVLQPTEEQGFHGWRLKQGPFEGGLCLGKGYLVFAMGEGVLETTLASLNNPPKGEDALLTGDVYAKAQTLTKLEPGLAFQVTDGERYTKMLKKIIETWIEQAGKMPQMRAAMKGHPSAVEEDESLRNQLAELVPSEDELANILGVFTGYVLVNEHGLVMKGVSELPAPE